MTMTDRNGDSRLDLEHELPAADDTQDEGTGTPESQGQSAAVVDEPAKLKAERDALYDRLARLQAEFDNVRKRQVKENQDFRDYALSNAILILLPIVDSFDRALQAPDGKEFRKGVELINRQFHDALSKLGVEPISAAGQPFDPNLHQAIQTVESEDVPENHVVDEFQRGYKLKDRLLRPAMVTVAKSSR
jgi:molecular chaperone GrpE